MSESIVYVDRSRVHDGRLDELRTAMAELVAFVDDNEPEILAYNVYFDEDGEQMTVIHVHADPSTLEYHMEVAGPKFPPIGEFITLESIDVYGHPGEDIVRRLREKASELGTGKVSIHERHRGVDRLSVD